MASTNQSPEYQRVEKKFLEAQTDSERILWLEEMIRECPKHKSAEKMLANLKTRYIKLKKKIETQKKSRKGGTKGIKKEDMQAVLVGFTNSGKSSLIKNLTNVKVKISANKFTTRENKVGILNYQGVQIQMIEIPSLKSEEFDIGLTNTADLVIFVVTKLSEINEIRESLPKIRGKVLVIFNKIDLLNKEEKRKLEATLKSKKQNFILTSSIMPENIDEVKEKIISNFDIARIYLKEPGKQPTTKPLVVLPNTTIEQVAKKISKDLAKKIKEVHIWGPSSKFGNQRVGLKHKVKDKDIVEFKTK